MPMILTLENFREEIHALILARGKDYLLRDLVKNIEETSDGWKATVYSESSDEYVVHLHGRRAYEEWSCTCPFDHGPVCKHVAALLYALHQQEAYLQEEIEMTGEHIAKLDTDETRALLDDAIEALPELRQFILKRYYQSTEDNRSEES